MLPVLARRTLAEALGTGALVCAVVGSGVMAQRLSPGDPGLQLLENSIATAFALIALIWTFGSVSGAHFNPVVTFTEWFGGRIAGRDVAPYVVAQTLGGIAGACFANAMFEVPQGFSTRARDGMPLWLAEVAATLGLLLTIRGTSRGEPRAVPLAVGLYIGAAYWFTSSTSFANPAVTLARAFSDSFAGIAPASVAGFVLAQGIGAAAFLGLARLLWPVETAATVEGDAA
jgi:glycerol uptake facilitator-like aquaporin